MGEKIKVLSSGNISGTFLEVELNKPTVAGHDLQVHIQSEKYRFELDRDDFIKCAMTILVAEKNLKFMKRINEAGADD